MTFKKNYIATLLGFTIAATSYGQDLIQQVPDHASFVVVVNNAAIVKHSSFEKINEVLDKVGMFDDFGGQEIQIQSITDLDLSYDRRAYIYKTDTDSSSYPGILLPLNAGHQVGINLFNKLSPLPASQGYERRVSADGKTQVAWNEHSALILTGEARRYYFDNDSVARRYGIERPDYGYGGATTTPDYWSIPADTAYDTYSDSTYQMELARNAKNDSLRHAAFASWLANDFDSYLFPAQSAASYKQLGKFDKKNTLMHFWAK